MPHIYLYDHQILFIIKEK